MGPRTSTACEVVAGTTTVRRSAVNGSHGPTCGHRPFGKSRRKKGPLAQLAAPSRNRGIPELDRVRPRSSIWTRPIGKSFSYYRFQKPESLG